MTSPVRLDTEYRARAWNRTATKEFDVLVEGGGVTGAAVALDAATRGLSTALVEQRDFASGTSSRSSKLFHGGLRYLEQMNFDLVREALKERELMLSRIAPHLVKPVSSSIRSPAGSGSGPTSPPGSPSTTPWAAPARSRGTSS